MLTIALGAAVVSAPGRESPAPAAPVSWRGLVGEPRAPVPSGQRMIVVLSTPSVAELWRLLDAAARRRAAACPYLLVDAGFADPQRWRQPAPLGVGDAGEAAYGTFFTVAGTNEVARLVFTYAWHLARAHGAAARLLLGMSAPCAALIAHLSLRQIHSLAQTHPHWLRPRWPARVQVWRELLLAAASGEAPVLERARLHGLTLLAADARASLPERSDAGALAP